MKTYRYTGSDVAYLDCTSLGQERDGCFVIQVDQLDHGMSHGWHQADAAQWKSVSPPTHQELDAAYVAALDAWDMQSDLPACPRCKGKMEAWDMWLATGATCVSCKWSYSEGGVP